MPVVYYIRLAKIVDRQQDKSQKYTRQDDAKDCSDWAKLAREVAGQIRLLTVPQEFQRLQSSTLSYINADAKNYQKWSENMLSPSIRIRRSVPVEMDIPHPYEVELRNELQRAGEKSDQFTAVLNELFPPKPKKF